MQSNNMIKLTAGQDNKCLLHISDHRQPCPSIFYRKYGFQEVTRLWYMLVMTICSLQLT